MAKRAFISTAMKPAHLRAVRALGYTLTLGDPVAWWDFSSIIASRLTVDERTALAFMALKSLDNEAAHLVAEAAIDRGAGFPPPPLTSALAEAAFWSDMANPEEREAYCLAAFRAMPRGRQAAFLDFARVGQAA